MVLFGPDLVVLFSDSGPRETTKCHSCIDLRFPRPNAPTVTNQSLEGSRLVVTYLDRYMGPSALWSIWTRRTGERVVRFVAREDQESGVRDVYVSAAARRRIPSRISRSRKGAYPRTTPVRRGGFV
jgi:hypothetical protein